MSKSTWIEDFKTAKPSKYYKFKGNFEGKRWIILRLRKRWLKSLLMILRSER